MTNEVRTEKLVELEQQMFRQPIEVGIKLSTNDFSFIEYRVDHTDFVEHRYAVMSADKSRGGGVISSSS